MCIPFHTQNYFQWKART